MMNKKQLLTLTAATLMAVLTAGAQTTDCHINWRGTAVLQADTLQVEVIKADNAVYERADLLPSIVTTLPAGQTFSQHSIENAVYEDVPEAEARLIGDAELGEQPTVTTYLVSGRESSQSVEVFPFVRQNGKLRRLTGYSLRPLPGTARRTASTGTHQYQNSSVLAEGKFYKVRVKESGLHRIPYSALPSDVDPKNIRVFGYGGAMLSQDFTLRKQDDLPEVPVYDDGANIVFYAQGPVSWSYDSNNRMFLHTQNPYSQYGYYFITSSGVGTGKRITTADAISVGDKVYTVRKFTDRQLHEQDLVNLVDPTGAAGGGREFYGEQFNPGDKLDLSFDFPNRYTTDNVRLRITTASSAQLQSTFTLTHASNTPQTISISPVSGHLIQAVASTRVFYSSQSSGSTVTFNLAYNSGSSTAKGYLNFLEVNANRSLVRTGDVMHFRNVEHIGDTIPSSYQLTNADQNTLIWDVTNPANTHAVSTNLNNTTLTFYADNSVIHEFVALQSDKVASLPQAEVLGAVDNQNLHALHDQDMVIITYPAFKAAAERLAQAHRSKDGFEVAVVTCDEVYNEFSSGTPDASAYRWIMKMLYDKAVYSSGRLPRYLVLMGDGSYDNRKLLDTSAPVYLLTFQAANSVSEPLAYATDDYFGFMDDTEGSSERYGTMEVAVGRLPVSTAAMADNVVSKIIDYMDNKTYGSWKNQITLLADDGDNNLLHTWQADSVARQLAPLTKDFVLNKLYLEAYQQEVSATGESYPLAKNRLDNQLNNGVLYFNYTGHGSALNITSEGMITQSSIRAMSNTNYALWALATCSFSHFDRSQSSSGEDALTNVSGGAIATFSASRTVYADNNITLNDLFSRALFTRTDGQYPRIGDAVIKAKAEIVANHPNDNVNKMAYVLLGDPALRLHYPDQVTVVTDSINGVAVSPTDTVRALQVVRLSGHVASTDSTELNDFNGVIQIQVFDKQALVDALDNDHTGGHFSYLDRQSTLYKGEATVTNGRWTTTFMVPKDIRYNYGSGLINYYVHDTISNTEGQGHYDRFQVGGSDAATVLEEDGPELSIYLNSTSFVSGGKVNETPTFLAFISDENGINTAGSGIGHDLMLIIDGDPDQAYNLNDYFRSTGSYKAGSVSYKMSQLEEGKHTLSFRAWDLLNNSTTKSLDFEVVNGLTPTLFSVISYPNPVRSGDNAYISISHDRPNTVMEAWLDIFDLSGRRVWTWHQNSADLITWPVSASGCRPGVYLYKVRVQTADSDQSSKTGKIIVVGQ